MSSWQILLIVFCSLFLLFILSIFLYKPFFKRFWDVVLSGLAIIILSPIFLVLSFFGAIFMKGNPFFNQKRPGKKNKNGYEKIFGLIKFRTMTNKKDDSGNLLPDEQRLNKYGKFLRSTSLDELPELFNIFIGDMSIVGPRPLLVRYLERYSDEQRHRHDVRPGLTGYAQCHGRNAVSWKEKFEMDLFYIKHISFFVDIRILFETVFSVFKREGISSDTSATMEEFTGNEENI